jgi:hypothetical protein
MRQVNDNKLVIGPIDSLSPIFVSGEARPILWRDVAKIVIPYSTMLGKRNQVTVFQNGKLARFTLDLPWTEISGKDETGNRSSMNYP